QDHLYEPRVIVLGISIDHDAVIAEDCCCPGDLADPKRALTPIPALHGERGRDKDGSLAGYGHQVSLHWKNRGYIKRFGEGRGVGFEGREGWGLGQVSGKAARMRLHPRS